MNKILYFTATWCGPCKALSPTVDGLIAEGLPFQKIDIDNDQSLSNQYDVRSVPTLIKVDANNNEINRLVGSRPADEIKNWYNN